MQSCCSGVWPGSCFGRISCCSTAWTMSQPWGSTAWMLSQPWAVKNSGWWAKLQTIFNSVMQHWLPCTESKRRCCTWRRLLRWETHEALHPQWVLQTFWWRLPGSLFAVASTHYQWGAGSLVQHVYVSIYSFCTVLDAACGDHAGLLLQGCVASCCMCWWCWAAIAGFTWSVGWQGWLWRQRSLG